MNDTVRDILGLLERGKPELQIAAAQILGELKPKDAAVGKALEAALDRSRDRVLSRYLLEALARLGSADALRMIARSLQHQDGLGDQAAHLLTELGKGAHGVLAEQFDSAPLEARLRMLAVVAREPSKEGLAILEKALFQHELTETAARILGEARDQLSAAQQKQVREGLQKQLEGSNGSLSPACQTHALHALGQIDPAGARAFLLKQAGDDASAEGRIAALRALRGVPLTPTQLKGFLQQLQDNAHKAVHDELRELLAEVTDWPAAVLPTLKKMLAARLPEQRLFALRALRGLPTPEVARLALKFLGHADERLRHAAAEALARNKSAVEPVLKAIQTERNQERAAVLVAILGHLKEHFQPRHLRALAERAIKQISTGNPLGEALLGTALQIDGEKAAPILIEKAIRMRRVKRFHDAAQVLAFVVSAHQGGTEALYQLALARLLDDARRPAPGTVVTAAPAAHGSATMGFFAQVARDGFPLLERIKKETMLGPDVLLRLARHFAEGVGAERKFALDLLQHLATRTRGRVGDEAKVALRTAGM